jgi:hypothetical protein
MSRVDVRMCKEGVNELEKGRANRLVCFVVLSLDLPKKGHNLCRLSPSLNESGRKRGFMDAEERLFPADVARHPELLNLEHGLAGQIQNATYLQMG